jgi:hypothetical protein
LDPTRWTGGVANRAFVPGAEELTEINEHSGDPHAKLA